MLKLDALFNFLGVLIYFILVLLAQINPPSADAKPPGELVVIANWPAGSADIDLWLSAPGDKAVGYQNKSGRVWSLLRDDLGTANDPTPINSEFATTRGLPDGEYAVNLSCYGCAGNVPISVAVEVRTQGAGLVWRGSVTLVRNKQEKTAIRFRVRNGAVIPGSESHVFKDIRKAK